MAKISEYLETIQPELAHTARLFGLADHLEEFRMEAEEGDGVFRIAFTDGEHTVRRAAAVPIRPFSGMDFPRPRKKVLFIGTFRKTTKNPAKNADFSAA